MKHKFLSIILCMFLAGTVVAHADADAKTTKNTKTPTTTRQIKPAKDEKTSKKDKKNSHPVKEETTHMTAALLNSVMKDKWIVQQIGNKKLKYEENYPYVCFEPGDASKNRPNKFYVSTGCNYINGEYSITEPNRISFHNVTATDKYCTDHPEDTDLKIALGASRGNAEHQDKSLTAEYVKTDDEEYIVLTDRNSNQIKLHKPSLEALEGNWQVVEINNNPIDNESLTIFFDMGARKIHGNTGCNSFNGDIYVDPINDKSLSLTNMGVTMRACPDMSLQQKLLFALEDASSVQFLKDGHILLKDSSGKTVMKLKSVPIDTSKHKSLTYPTTIIRR